VSGVARIVDNCTIEVTAFNYDGGGLPDVFFYGGVNNDYRNGFPIGANLFGRPMVNATVTLTLRDGDLDRMDGISVWCVRANANFGDGKFAAP
jgi:hypothetical protein